MTKLKNILLVYPEIPSNTYWSFKYALRFINKKSAMPPLGLITIAALIPEKYNLKLIDMNIEPLRKEAILWADAVFVSAMIVQKDSMARVVARCKSLQKTVVAGGPYPTSCRQEISDVDHLVLGEVEDTFNDFLADLENGTAKKVYPLPKRPDMSNSVIPRFDLLNMKAYSSMSIQHCRGCPFNCEFCDIWKVYGNKPRLKNPAKVVREIEALYALGWRGPIFIVDDNFIGNKKQVKKELLPTIRKWQAEHNYVYRFFTEASINIADDEELLAGMRDAGFNEVFVGIETPSMESLQETGKTQNLKADMTRSIRTIQQYGIEVMAGFILGFDSDAEDIFDRLISFIQETGIPQAMVGLLTALPGTKLYNRLKKENRILFESFGNNTHTLATNFKTIMDRMKLKSGYEKVLASIYDSNLKNYFSRCNKLMDNLGYTKYFQRNIHLNDVITLLRSLCHQPFTPYGYQYLKFVIRNFFKNRKIFSETIRFGIVGHHFHIITQEMLKIEQIASYLDESYNYLSEQTNLCSSLVVGSSKEAFRNIVKLWTQRKEILKEARNKIDKIHSDFRADISAQHSDIAEKMKELFKAFENDLIKHGIVV
jgi:radical SAM superfamily enzyme YgiQ (UPF0313 family)